jgi:hypothetical protein
LLQQPAGRSSPAQRLEADLHDDNQSEAVRSKAVPRSLLTTRIEESVNAAKPGLSSLGPLLHRNYSIAAQALNSPKPIEIPMRAKKSRPESGRLFN